MAQQKARPFTPAEERLGRVVIRWMSHANTWIYRQSGGRLGGRWLRGAPVMLLTTIGRKSRQLRTIPLLYLQDGPNVICVASQGGMSKHPLWFRNLLACPDVEVEIGTRKRRMTARQANEAERAALWPRLIAMYRDFDDYQERTDRRIPVVILEPA